ncbi:MAG: hypothetical protein IJG23_07400 [Clostridia bacterium]|nr:hypothetical protein [Clostridia bacterium]
MKTAVFNAEKLKSYIEETRKYVCRYREKLKHCIPNTPMRCLHLSTKLPVAASLGDLSPTSFFISESISFCAQRAQLPPQFNMQHST